MRVYASAEMTLTDTNDGISVTGIDRYYMASSSSEGITVDSEGWQEDPQETNPISRYHWSYEVVNYSDGPPVPSKPAIIGVYGRDGKEGVDAVTVALSSEAHTFAGTESKAIASSITIDISAFKGNQRIPTSIGAVTGGIPGQLTHSELDEGKTTNKLVINVTNALDKSDGTLSIPIEADGKTFHKVFSWSVAFKGKVGDKGDTGPQGPRGIQGPSGSNGQSQYVHIRYSANSNGSGMDTKPSSTTKYVGIAVTDSDKAPGYTGFTWSKYVGENGGRGPQGLPGKNGDDGQTTYTWVRYADTPTSGMDQFPAGKKYIGLAFNQTTQDESNDYSDYQWSLMPQNIEIGGRNLLKNTSDELKSYSKASWDWNTQTLLQSDFDRLKIGVEDELTLSVYIDKPSQNAKAFIQFVGHGPAYRTYQDGNTISQGQSGWSYLTIKIASADLNNFSRMEVSVRGGSNSAGTVKISHMKLEKGNIATDWTPAPEDLYQYVDDIEIGGRNYALNTDRISENSYNLSVNIPDELKGEIVTISFYLELENGTAGSQGRIGVEGNNVDTTGKTTYYGAWYYLNNGKDFRGIYSWSTRINKNFSGNTLVLKTYQDLISADVKRLGYVKVEKGNKATDWTPAPEDVQSQIDDKANQTDTEAKLNEIASDLLVKQQEIEAAATAGELDAFVKKYNQEQEAFAKEKQASENALASAKDAIDLITNKMDNMAETWEFFDEYIKFEKGSIVLGNQTEGSHVRIHNDRISFYSNGYEVAAITQGRMTIEAGTFVEEIQISEFKFQKSSNGHLTVRHVG